MESAIREGLFAFGWEAARQGWLPPPFALRLADLPADVARLFERAFSGEAAAGARRPTASEWVVALDKLEARLATCSADGRHCHARGDDGCPWCRVEAQGGLRFFPPPLATSLPPDVAAAWRAIEAAARPGPPVVPPAPDPGGLPRPAPAAGGGAPHRRWIVAGSSPSSSPGVRPCPARRALRGGGRRAPRDRPQRREVPRPRGHRAARSRESRRFVRARGARLEVRYRAEAGDGPFRWKLEELRTARKGLESMRGVEEGEKRIMVERVRRWMLERYLDDHALEAAGLPSFGALEIDSLQKQGLRSAGDVDPGVLPSAGAWRQQLRRHSRGRRRSRRLAGQGGRELRDRPRAGAGAGRPRGAGGAAQEATGGVGQALCKGVAELKRLRREILARRDERLPALEALQRRLAQLRADLEEVGWNGCGPVLAGCRAGGRGDGVAAGPSRAASVVEGLERPGLCHLSRAQSDLGCPVAGGHFGPRG